MAMARPGERVAELGRVIERRGARPAGFSVLREVAGHGVGRTIHEPPDVLNYFNPHLRDRLEEGQVMAVEPIIAMKPARVRKSGDGWTLRTHERRPRRALRAHRAHHARRSAAADGHCVDERYVGRGRQPADRTLHLALSPHAGRAILRVAQAPKCT